MPRIAPLTQILHAYALRRVQVASAAAVNLKTIDKLCTGSRSACCSQDWQRLLAPRAVTEVLVIDERSRRHHAQATRSRSRWRRRAAPISDGRSPTIGVTSSLSKPPVRQNPRPEPTPRRDSAWG